LNWVNGQHLKNIELDKVLQLFKQINHPSVKERYLSQSDTWKKEFISLFMEKVQVLNDYIPILDSLFNDSPEIDEDAKAVLDWETTPKIIDVVKNKCLSLEEQFLSKELLNEIMDSLKKDFKIKGKALFMGLRVVLTGYCHGGDLTRLIPLTPLSIIKERLKKIS